MQAYANPARFNALALKILPWCTGLTVLLLATGLYYGLVKAPQDYQQGETVRIMFVHVPAAWMALACYSVMALASAEMSGLRVQDKTIDGARNFLKFVSSGEHGGDTWPARRCHLG